MRTVAIFISLLILTSTTVSAAPPKAEWLHPAGVGQGVVTTIELSDAGVWPVKVWIDQPQGVAIEAHKDKNKLTVTTTADALPGVRWLRLFNDDGASSLRPLLVGTLLEVQEKEPNNTVKQAQLVAENVTLNGRLEKSGDVDVYRVPLRRGQTLIASMLANRVLSSPMDGVLQVCRADGSVLTQNDDALALDPQIVFEVPSDGDYLIRAFAFPATPDSSIQFAGKIDFIYRLTLTTSAYIDHTTPLAATQGEATDLALHGWNIPTEISKLALTPQADRDVAMLFHPKLANTIDLPVTTFPLIVASPGSSAAKPQQASVPCVITGQIEKEGASHVFGFAAKKGENLRLRIESQTLGFPLDPVLRIMEADGKLISETDDTAKERDPTILFKPTADGDYRVSVRDLHGRGGERFVYRMTIEAVVADYALTLATDVFTWTPGKPLEIPVTIDRRDGLTGEIAVSVEGLPEGAKATPVVSKMKDASEKTVKVVIDGGGEAWSGPVKIIGKSGEKQRVATFATVGEARHQSAWMTVVKQTEKTKKGK